jgi:hypothetical protein
MRVTIDQTYKELKAINALFNQSPKKVHGERVVRFSAKVDQFFKEQWFEFDAPQCSSKKDLESYMYYQVPAFKAISDSGVNGEDYKIYYRTK